LTFSLKNEKSMNKIVDIVNSLNKDKDKDKENTHILKPKILNLPLTKNQFNSSSKKSTGSQSSNSREMMPSMYSTYRNGFININPNANFKKIPNKKFVQNKTKENTMTYKPVSVNRSKHQKNKSVGEFINYNYDYESSFPTMNGKTSNSFYIQTQTETERGKEVKTKTSKLNQAREKNYMSKSRNSSIEFPSVTNTPVFKPSHSNLNPYSKEENSSLQKMIHGMLQSAKKVKPNRQAEKSDLTNLSNSKNFLDESSIFDDATSHGLNVSYSKSNNQKIISTSLDSMKKQLNKIIKLSLPTTERINLDSQTSFSRNQFKPSRLNFDQSFTKTQDEKEKSTINNINTPNPSKTFNFNLSQDEMSFDEKEKIDSAIFFTTGQNETHSEQKEKVSLSQNITTIESISQKLENFEEYFFDPCILKRLLKSHDLSKKDLGQIFNYSTKDFIKSHLLTEMIAILSKQFLQDSIILSLEIVLKEKDLNKNYFIGPSHQHSIEFCIIDVFNILLGSSKDSEEFYTKILPNFLTEKFKINFLLEIKGRISIPNLFVLMQSHNKIYFNDNLDINFANPKPFIEQDIKFISPYYVNKWYKLTIEKLGREKESKNKNKNSNEKNCPLTTNIKRMKYSNFEMRDSLDKMLSQLKRSEKEAEDLRIDLIKNIYFHIFNKRNELALKLCDYYVQKYADTISLNPIIYLVLAEIYNETAGLELARLFYEKAVNIINWQFGNNKGEVSNPILIDLNYTFSLILMKNCVTNFEDSRESQIQQSQIQEAFYKEIEELLDKSKLLCDKFFNTENEKRVKIVLQSSLIKLSHYENYSENEDELGCSSIIAEIIEEVIKSMEYLRKNGLYKEEASYLNLFVDVLKSVHFAGDEMKIQFIQRLVKILFYNKIYLLPFFNVDFMRSKKF
jgi:hypothetical protein